jgi:hypothetical protein
VETGAYQAEAGAGAGAKAEKNSSATLISTVPVREMLVDLLLYVFLRGNVNADQYETRIVKTNQ